MLDWALMEGKALANFHKGYMDAINDKDWECSNTPSATPRKMNGRTTDYKEGYKKGWVNSGDWKT